MGKEIGYGDSLTFQSSSKEPQKVSRNGDESPSTGQWGVTRMSRAQADQDRVSLPSTAPPLNLKGLPLPENKEPDRPPAG